MSYALIDGSTVFVDILTNEDDAILMGTILENKAASSYLTIIHAPRQVPHHDCNVVTFILLERIN